MIKRHHIWLFIAILAVAAVVVGLIISILTPNPPTEPIDPEAVEGGAPADQVPVLCYHYVRRPGSPLQFARVFGYVVLSLPLLDDAELWKVSRRGFERQIEYLVKRGYRTVSLDDLHEWQMGRRALPARSIVLTFDDADESVYDYAYPLLKKHGLRATVFVVTAHVGKSWNGIRCLDWERLREMQRSGVFDIESHTHDSHYKVGDRDHARPVFVAASESPDARGVGARWNDALFDDLNTSRVAIERQIGRTPRFLAWPYGFGNPAVDQIAFDAGFTRTCALRARATQRLAGQRLVLADTERFEIPRYTVTARTSLRTFRGMLQGTYRPER